MPMDQPDNQPTRLAHLDDGNDRAILVQGDEGPAQVVRLGHQGTPSVRCSDDGAISSPPAPYHLSVPLGRATASNWLSSVREHRDPMASPAAKASRLTEVPRQDKSGYG